MSLSTNQTDGRVTTSCRMDIIQEMTSSSECSWYSAVRPISWVTRQHTTGSTHASVSLTTTAVVAETKFVAHVFSVQAECRSSSSTTAKRLCRRRLSFQCCGVVTRLALSLARDHDHPCHGRHPQLLCGLIPTRLASGQRATLSPVLVDPAPATCFAGR